MVSSGVNQIIFVAIQRAVAFNALTMELRNTKLPKGRVVGQVRLEETGGMHWDDDMGDEEFSWQLGDAEVQAGNRDAC